MHMLKQISFLTLLSILLISLSSFFFNKKVVKKPQAILFMLHQNERKINQLKEKNRKSDADLVTLETQNTNNALINYLSASVTFCPVYFFYSSDFEHVIQKNWDSVNFVNNKPTTKQLESYFIGDYNEPSGIYLHDENFQELDFILNYTPINLTKKGNVAASISILKSKILDVKLFRYYENYEKRMRRQQNRKKP
jgi:hypothetical protein